MPDVLVKNVDERILEKLRDRARENGRSLQNELIQMFRIFVESDDLSDEERASQIKESLRGRKFSDSAVLLREDRNR